MLGFVDVFSCWGFFVVFSFLFSYKWTEEAWQILCIDQGFSGISLDDNMKALVLVK